MKITIEDLPAILDVFAILILITGLFFLLTSDDAGQAKIIVLSHVIILIIAYYVWDLIKIILSYHAKKQTQTINIVAILDGRTTEDNLMMRHVVVNDDVIEYIKKHEIGRG